MVMQLLLILNVKIENAQIFQQELLTQYVHPTKAIVCLTELDVCKKDLVILMMHLDPHYKTNLHFVMAKLQLVMENVLLWLVLVNVQQYRVHVLHIR